MDKLRLEWKYKNPEEYSNYRLSVQEKMAEATEMYMEANPIDKQRYQFEATLKKIINQSSMIYLLEENKKRTEYHLEQNENPEIQLLKKESNIWDVVGNLELKYSQIIKLMYLENLKQKEISDKLQLSKSKICRLHSQALELLKEELDKLTLKNKSNEHL